MTVWVSAPLSVVLVLSAAAPPGAECGSDLACTARAYTKAARHGTPADKASHLLTAARSRLALFRGTGETIQLCWARGLIVRAGALPHNHLGDRPAATKREIDTELKRLKVECGARRGAKSSPDTAPGGADEANTAPEREPGPVHAGAKEAASPNSETLAAPLETELLPTDPNAGKPRTAPAIHVSARSVARRAVGGTLAGLAGALTIGTAASLTGRHNAREELDAINAAYMTENRAPTDEELAAGVAVNDRGRRLGITALALGLTAGASLVAGLVVLLARPRADSRARLRASGAGLVYSF
jgi:hypothetical protein